MPGIDYTLLRQRLSLAQVLDLVGFTATTRRGPQLRGPCSVHGSTTPRSRSFAAHLENNCWHCFRCGAGGNALDLYLAVTRLPVYAGALELCARLQLPVPRRDTPVSRRACRPPRGVTEPTPRRAVELHGLTEARQGRTPPRKPRPTRPRPKRNLWDLRPEEPANGFRASPLPTSPALIGRPHDPRGES
jgi:hypothetical protein